jgi:PAS domain S-box-containing protein
MFKPLVESADNISKLENNKNGITEATLITKKAEPKIILLLDQDGIIMLLEGNDLEEVCLNRYELIGSSIHETYPNKPEFLKRVNEAILSKQQFTTFENGLYSFEIYLTPIWRNKNRNSGLLGIAIDTTEQGKAADELNLHKSYFQQLFENSPDAIAILDNYDRLININAGFEKLFGFSIKEANGKNINEIILPEDLLEESVEISEILSKGKTVQRETVRIKKDGARLEVNILAYPVSLENERYGAFHVYTDISRRKRSEEHIISSLLEKEILLKEIHHRVKNNLQVISSLLYVRSKFIKDPQTTNIFLECQNQVKSIALIHEKLYHTSSLSRIDFDKYLKTLIPHLYKTFGVKPDKVALTVKAHNIFLSADTAIPCGLIINELVTNSLKYAFPAYKKGIIFIELIYHNDNKLTLIVKDNGIGLPKNININSANTLGLQLVTTLVKQLDGTIEVNTSAGTEYRITFSILNFKGGYH